MKKYLFVVFIVFSASAFAMYQSNPAGPEMIDRGLAINPDFFLGIKAGYQFDRVFDRRMTLSNVSGHVNDSKILAHQGVVTLNFFDRAEIWGSTGSANFHFNDEIRINSNWQRIDFKRKNNWIWGVGGRASFFSWGSLTLGGSAGYERTDNYKLHYSEWQIGLGLAYQVHMFAPYVGGTFSRAFAHLRHLGIPSISTLRMHNTNHYGVTVGCDFSPGNFIDLGVEYRMISEFALTVKGDIKF